MRLQDDELFLGEAPYANAEKNEVSVQFSPGFVHTPTDETNVERASRLRGCFVCIPEDDAARRWSNNLSARDADLPIKRMFENVNVEIAAYPGGTPETISVCTVHPWDDDTVAMVADGIWERVLDRPYSVSGIEHLRGIIGTPKPTRRSDPAKWNALALPLETRPTDLPRDNDDLVLQDPGGRISSSGLAVVDQALINLHLATMLSQAFHRQSPTVASSHGADLFSARSLPQVATLPNVSDAGNALYADRARQWSERIVSRGLAAGTNASRAANDALNSRATGKNADPKPFHRVEPDPGPDATPSETLVETVTHIIGDIGAQNWHLAAGSQVDIGPPVWADAVNSQIRTTLQKGKDNGQGLQLNLGLEEMRGLLEATRADGKSILTMVQLGLRPDARDRQVGVVVNRGRSEPVMASRQLALEGNPFGNLSFEDAEFLVTHSDNLIQNRIGGLMALPIAARIARLVFDIDIDLEELERPLANHIESGGKFTIKVIPNPDVASELTLQPIHSRTVCQLVSMDDAPGGKIFVASEETAAGESEHRNGILNIQQKMHGRPRFHFSSTDVAGFASRTWNEGEANAAMISSGYDPESAPGTLRSSGVAMYDTGAAEAVGRNVNRSADDLRFAGDICTGYRVDVGVTGRKTGSAKGWRSLCRKFVEFQNESAESCEALSRLTDAAASIRRTIAGTGIYDENEIDLLLNETTIRPGARTIRDGDGQEQAILYDMVFEWMGDPLATACTATRNAARHKSVYTHDDITIEDDLGEREDEFEEVDLLVKSEDSGTEAVVHFVEDLPTDGMLPPRLEYQRTYHFGMRSVYLGGYSLPLQLAAPMYDGELSEFLGTHTHLRMENLPSPRVFEVDQRPRHGETLELMAIRDTVTRDRSRRILAVPSVALDMAAMHPTPEAAEQQAGYSGPWRVLDGRRPIRGRKRFPAGGWPFVSSMAQKPKKQVEELATGERRWLADPLDRSARGAPPRSERERNPFTIGDVSISKFRNRAAQYYPDPMVAALRLQLVDPRGGKAARTESYPVYEDDYYQAVPNFISSQQSERCRYPNAIPILLVLEEGATDTIKSSQIGYLDNTGRFNRMRAGDRPPANSMTVRRVIVALAEGSDMELRCNCLRFSEYREGFGPHVRTIAMLKDTRRFDSSQDPLLDAFGGQEELLQEFASDQLVLRLVHAVEKPSPPILSNDAAMRKTLDTDSWRKNTQLMQAAEENSDLFASQTWLNGTVGVETKVVGDLTLSIAYSDLRYDPYKPTETDADGNIKFERLAPYTVELRLDRAAIDEPSPRIIDLVQAGLIDGPAMLQLPDSRAYELEITPIVSSRFRSFFDPGTRPSQFASVGQSESLWIKATKRPASLGFVEMLPAFVWEERSEGVSHSRRMVVRLRWRNKQYAKDVVQGPKEATGWPSSGKNEELAILLRGAHDAGKLEQFVSRIGGDAIRTGGDPDASLTLEDVLNFTGTKAESVFVPAPGKADEAGAALDPTNVAGNESDGAVLDLLRYPPRYEARGRYWYVDLDIGNPNRIPEPLRIGAPWVRLGLARYQEHALHGGNPSRDLRVSTPSLIEFRLEPYRRVDVVAEPSIRLPDGTRAWPITVTVYGRTQYLKGSASDDPSGYKASQFSIALLRKPRTIADWFGEGGMERVKTVDCDESKFCQATCNPQSGILWKETILSPKNPRNSSFYMLVEETERMLDANASDEGDKIDSGPRFIARIKVVT